MKDHVGNDHMRIMIQYIWLVSSHPAQLEKLFKTLRDFLTEFRSKRMKVMSSANKLILISFLSMFIRFMFELFLILFARVSNAVINR